MKRDKSAFLLEQAEAVIIMTQRLTAEKKNIYVATLMEFDRRSVKRKE